MTIDYHWVDDASEVAVHEVHVGDGLAFLRDLPPGSVAAVVTDPPWNLGRHYGPRVDDRRDPADYLDWVGDLVAAALAAAADTVVLLPGAPNLPGVAARVRPLAGWSRLLRWDPPPVRADEDALSLEPQPVLWLRHHPPPAPAPTAPLRVPLRPDPFLRHHPNPKPVALARAILERCVHRPGTVVDPCAGTGSVLAAAVRARRRAVGVEIEPRFAALARRRLDGRVAA